MEDNVKIHLRDYEKKYNEKDFWDTVKDYASSAGLKVIAKALLLYYSMDKLDAMEKALVYGALGYFIFPFDLIPDVMPIMGYTDDLAALAFAYGAIASKISPESKAKTKEKLKDIFPSVSDDEISEAL